MANKKDVKPDKKVQPSKKKKEEKKDDRKSLKDKATLMIMRHPELMNNARGLFRNENGKTIVEEMVPRGDLDTEEQVMPRNQGDLDNDDLRELALYASDMVDKDLLQYDPKVAFEDALQRAIWGKDDGRYQSRVNASTFQLILDNMKSMKKKKAAEETSQESSEEEEQDRQAQEEQPEEQPEEQSSVSDKSSSDAEENPEENSPGGVKEAKMDEALLKKEIAATRKRLAALQVLAGEEESEEEEAQEEGTSKEAAETFKCPKCGTKVLKKTGYCVKCKAKVKPKGSKEASEKTAAQKVAEQLDEIADLLESHDDPELMKLAYEIDEVSDSLDGKKTAAALESDSDEPYMKKYFRHGALEKDSDEPYMKEFDEDISTELRNKQQKGQLGKEASMPYKIRKD